jgi:hypothetical protein
MKRVLLILAFAFHGNAAGQKFDDHYKNKVSAGLDGHLRYERVLPYGIHVGTDWKYKTVMEGGRLVHFDQQPEAWLLTASHLWENRLLILENRVSFGKLGDYVSATFDLGIRKQFRLEPRWAVAPFVRLIEYVFDPGAFDEGWPSRRQVHHGEFKTELGIELELLF